MKKINDRKIVIVNQASNYLTVGFCNAFIDRFEDVSLITGSVHVQGEVLNKGIKVVRINRWIEKPAYRKFISYIIGCIRIYTLILFRFRKHEIIFVSIPPMAYLLNIIIPNRSSMVIWDVYPDAFKITGMKESNLLYRIWAGLNKRSFKKAYRVYTIGDRMGDLLEKYIDRDRLIIQPIWSIFQKNGKVNKKNNPFLIEQKIDDKFIVQYSGNIGLSHKVEVVIELAELLKDHKDILFQIIGRGPREPFLRKIVQERKLPNCQFLPFQSDEMFPYSLSAADVGVVILDAVTAKGSVPSKSYNLMSYGIPSLYVASKDSELSLYTQNYNHAVCFTENELDNAAEFLLNIKSDKKLWEKMSKNAIKASMNFRRDNADKFVEKYIE